MPRGFGGQRSAPMQLPQYKFKLGKTTHPQMHKPKGRKCSASSVDKSCSPGCPPAHSPAHDNRSSSLGVSQLPAATHAPLPSTLGPGPRALLKHPWTSSHSPGATVPTLSPREGVTLKEYLFLPQLPTAQGEKTPIPPFPPRCRITKKQKRHRENHESFIPR